MQRRDDEVRSLALQRQAAVAVRGAHEHGAPALRLGRVDVLHAAYGECLGVGAKAVTRSK